MNQLHAIKAFRSLVEAGSFSLAAERLNTTHSTISRHLQQLEHALGAQLVNRTTRHLSVTSAGEHYYLACIDILDRLDQAALSVSCASQKLGGSLRISVSMVIGTLELASWLPAFQKRYPEIRLELSCSDRFVDLVAGGFDLALRIAESLTDTTLAARLLAVSEVRLVASPRYIARHGLPRTANDLQHHQLLGFSGGHAEWLLTSATGQPERIRPAGMLRSDSIAALHAAALAGSGIAAFTDITVRQPLAQGQLVTILPDWSLGQRRYHALYPQTRYVSPWVRAFIDFMVEHYRGASG
ncbi:LysR family transcriptional regulator [Pseudomonas coronafaciens]|uniref:LysR family transcriptional regulator n=1 Tax=Pseudomonas coronafaciens TaxID=53409 RepID=UPI0006D6096E|nr:LysR family transcriptional regulator [Pseudomonas coronafaciens]KPZ22653.1 LysR family transcriptional regulator [Pseudomonas coronafaciens pv. zizaniae]